ncbi:SHC-adaptor protein [Arctopsyche grandis]|uniref:SHC-adaptor protein n=1 Tax=Arctopsyche grandis TaxID=121162 RepID=UPI00406D7438
MSSTNMSENASFIAKPARGWLHPDLLVSKDGVNYTVRYIGCLEIYTSMKSLDFETRSLVAKECINRVCEAVGLKTADKKRRVDKRVTRAIAEKPRMVHAGTNVSLTISSKSLSMSVLEGGEVIARHDMPRISFASGGDADTLDFVAYVAKNLQDWRACYVVECGGELAQDVISTIGQAFSLRYKEFVKHTPSIVKSLHSIRQADKDYYNDLPGKTPPDISPLEVTPPVPPLPINTHYSGAPSSLPTETFGGLSVGNLIDLSTPPPTGLPPYIPPTTPLREHNYVNDTSILTSQNSASQPPQDVFGMQPFSAAIKKLDPAQQHASLMDKPWFHGPVSRANAEKLVENDGDFLVRESQGSPGQYVLTGVQQNSRKHLLLIDPEGVVRTKDRVFDSVNHLISYHCNNELPIISAESTLILRKPILKTTPLTN